MRYPLLARKQVTGFLFFWAIRNAPEKIVNTFHASNDQFVLDYSQERGVTREMGKCVVC